MPYDNAVYSKQWKIENKEHVAAYQKQWRIRNRTNLKRYEQERHITECASKPHRAARGTKQYYLDPEKARLYQYKKQRGMDAEACRVFDATTNCSLCLKEVGARELGKRHKLHVDHDHKTGKIRGFLCNKCNTGLGKLGDTIEGLERALAYLRGNN